MIYTIPIIIPLNPYEEIILLKEKPNIKLFIINSAIINSIPIIDIPNNHINIDIIVLVDILLINALV